MLISSMGEQEWAKEVNEEEGERKSSGEGEGKRVEKGDEEFFIRI